MYVNPSENIGKWKKCVGKVGWEKSVLSGEKFEKNGEKNCMGKVWCGKSLG